MVEGESSFTRALDGRLLSALCSNDSASRALLRRLLVDAAVVFCLLNRCGWHRCFCSFSNPVQEFLTSMCDRGAHNLWGIVFVVLLDELFKCVIVGEVDLQRELNLQTPCVQ